MFKIFTTAMALDDGVSDLASRYDATNPIQVGGFTIHDDHPQQRWLTVPEIFMYSSNIGAAQMALDAGTDRQRDFLGRLGCCASPASSCRRSATPLVPSPVAADQHHDHRLRPRHLGQPAAGGERGRARWSMAASCIPPPC